MSLRNEVMDNLSTVLKTMPSIKTVSRRYKDYSSVSVSLMPYLILMKPREQYPPRAISALPAKRTFKAELVIYISAGSDQTTIPDETVCDLMDELDTIFRPPIGSQTLTLSGLVDFCYIDGEVLCVPGDLDGIGLMHVPLTIVVP